MKRRMKRSLLRLRNQILRKRDVHPCLEMPPLCLLQGTNEKIRTMHLLLTVVSPYGAVNLALLTTRYLCKVYLLRAQFCLDQESHT